MKPSIALSALLITGFVAASTDTLNKGLPSKALRLLAVTSNDVRRPIH